MDSETILLCMMTATAMFWYVKRRQVMKKSRRWWVRPINRQRNERGQYVYFKDMKELDACQFFKYTRMSPTLFDTLLSLLKERITKHSLREPISAECRLAMTLHYLSQGGSMQNVAWAYHCSKSVVSNIIRDTCTAIWEVLSPIYMQPPTVDRWCHIANGFWSRWNMPHCLGAIDGKHVVMQAPINSGSLYFNYKKQHSLVLMAACDHNYCFTLLDIGGYGGQNDGGIFSNSEFGKAINNKTLNIPHPQCLPNSEITYPHYFVGDEAFPLKEHLMRPYPGRFLQVFQRTFNYRLSRARRIIENAFGILASRWRVFRFPIIAHPDTVQLIVQATVCLHNFIKCSEDDGIYCPTNYVDVEEDGNVRNGAWRQEGDIRGLTEIGRMGSNLAQRTVYGLRDTLANYFLSEHGMVPWQDGIINRGRVPDIELV